MLRRYVILIFSFSFIISCKRVNSGKNESNHLGILKDLKRKSDVEILRMIADGKANLKDGDAVLRTDDDFVSETLRNMSQHDNTFSHCGIVFKEDGEWYVYNNMAGAENVKEQMMRVPYDSFVSPHEKVAYGIFRYNMSDSEVVKLHQITQDYYNAGLKFDKTFDLQTDDKMYCAEMVYKFVKKATNNRIQMHTTKKENFKVRDPRYQGVVIKEFIYVALDDLYREDPNCKEIGRYLYVE